MRNKLSEALDHISDSHIAEAATARKRHRPYWLGAVAAVLAVILLLNIGFLPAPVQAAVVSNASAPRIMERPDLDDYENRDAWRADLELWNGERALREEKTAEAVQTLRQFFSDSSIGYLSGTGGENRVWSPVNGYIALAMLAEVTEGQSRQQLLDALGEPDLQTLRGHVSAVWESVYTDDGHEISAPATSLWLNEGLGYDQSTMDALAYHHYATVYQADLSSRRAEKALQAWLSNNTGGLLKRNASTASFPEEAVLTLASTVYLQAKWNDEFNPLKNSSGIFHAPGGTMNVTFMNKKLYQTYYYWGDSYGAVSLGLKNGTRMWFLLPDPDKTVDDVLREGQFWEDLTVSHLEEDGKKYMKVNLSVPKFDISSSADLQQMLRELGITDIFDEHRANFSSITADAPVTVTAVNQAARIIVDEQGVKAASYIEIPGAGAAAPPEEIIDFILDRPFLFVLADDSGIPLFAGVVNEP